MKFPITAGAVAFASLTFLTLAIGQDVGSEQKHVTIPTLNGNRPVALSALHIERGVGYPSIVRLTGKVEIRMPVCVPTGKKGSTICDV